jgi:excisionase family DNA binding protein
MDDEYITVNEVAEQLRVSLKTVYNLINDKKLPHVRIGRSIRIERKKFNQWLATRQNAPSPG